MPSLQNARTRNQARITAGGETGTRVGLQGALNPAPTPPQDLSAGGGLPQRGMFSADLVLASDRSDSSRAFRGQGMRSATFPYSVQGIKTAPSITVPATSAAAAALSLALETNGLPNPNQNLLNLVQGANISIVANPDGSVVISGGGGDGLIHGASIWESDPAYVILRDDFFSYTNTVPGTGSLQQIGELGWAGYGSAVNAGSMGGGETGHLGQYSWYNNTTAGNALALTLNDNAGTASFYQGALSLLDNPGWQMTWVWKWDGFQSSTSNFNKAKKSFYVGLAGNTLPLTMNTGGGNSARPDIFVGLRYDTSATPGTLTLTAAANASGGTTSYTGTITGGLNGAYIGLTFVVTGFTNSSNNGSFVCVQSTTTALTLMNASGIAETHAATAAGGGLNDSFYTFEAVVNPSYSSGARHNKQGTTSVTSTAPVAGVWHRLDMVCTTAGVVTMTLDGAATFTVTVPSISATGISSSQVSVNNGIGRASFSTIGTAAPNNAPVWTAGSIITISGLSGGNASLNGKWTLSSQTSSLLLFVTSLGNIGNNSTGFTVTGLPALTPYLCFGNDDTASPVSDTAAFVDFFSFVWNPGVGGGTGTPTPTLSRYW